MLLGMRAGGGPRPVAKANFLTTTSLPSWLTLSRAGHATMYDSSGYLTFAPNNIQTYSEDFRNTADAGGTRPWVYTNNTISANAVVAPDGTTTADKLVEDGTASAAHGIYGDVIALTTGYNWTYSLYVKLTTPSERTRLRITAWAGTGTFASGPQVGADFNISSVTSASFSNTGIYTFVNSTITSVGNDWYRCSVTLRNSAGSFTYFTIRLLDGSGNASYNGDGSSGLYIWGAQTERITYETTPRTYNATTSAAYYGPRFDYDPVSVGTARGLLIEASRTNLAVTSETFSTSWLAVASSFSTAGGDLTTSPDGTIDAGRLTEDTSSGRHFLYLQRTTVASTVYTFSVFAKAGTKNFVAIGLRNTTGTTGHVAVFDLSNGTRTTTNNVGSPTSTESGITPVGNGWYRIYVTMAADTIATFSEMGLSNSGTPSYSSNMPTYTGTSQHAFFWGAQLEAGSKPTSYIPTTTGSVQRLADTFSMTGVALTTLQGAEGSVVSEVTSFDNLSEGAIIGSNSMVMQVGNNVGELWNGSVGLPSNSGVGDFTSPTRVGAAWSGTTRSFDITGVAVTTDSNAFAASAITSAFLGSSAGSTLYLNGHIRKLYFYNTRFSDSTLLRNMVVPGYRTPVWTFPLIFALKV